MARNLLNNISFLEFSQNQTSHLRKACQHSGCKHPGNSGMKHKVGLKGKDDKNVGVTKISQTHDPFA